MAKMNQCPLDVRGLIDPITSIPPTSQMAKRRMLDGDAPTLDEQRHCGSDMHDIA